MNKKTKKQLIIGGLITGAALLIINEQNKASKLTTQPTTPTTPTTPTPSTPTVPVVTYPVGFPIVYGKYNANAKRLQQAMTGITADGIIGANTLARWQQFNPAIKSNFIIANEAELQAAINQINSKYVPLPTFPFNPPSPFATNAQSGNVVAETVITPAPYYGTDNGPIEYTRADYGEVMVSGVKKSLL
jgi:hypothetical protein